jgi:signal transduction histidine kinase
MPRSTRTCLVALAVIASPWTGVVVSAQSTVQTVLAIHWGPETFPATPVVNGAILAALRANPAPPAVEYFTEYLQSDVLPPEHASLALRDSIRQKYHGRRIDVVIAIADPALRFVLDHRAELFPDTPIVFSGVAIPKGTSRTAAGGLTAVMRGVAYRETLKLALELHPSTSRVFVVANGRDGRTMESVRAEFYLFEQRVALTYLREPMLPRLLAAVRNVPPQSLILYIWHEQGEPGRLVYQEEIARRVAEASPVPVYGTNDDYIGSGVVGGVARRTHETADRVGQMARQILSGTPAHDIPIENARLLPIFDWRAVERWGIDPAQIPSGAQILFREPTAWESYRGYIILTIGIIAVQLLLIAALLTQRAQLRQAEHALRDREATLRASYQRSRLLAGRLINAQEAARAGIARDLHDDLCQELAAVSIAVSCLERSSGDLQDPRTRHALSMLHRHVQDVANEVRNLSHALHPASLRLFGLAEALRGHCVEVERLHDVQVGFAVDGDLAELSSDIVVCLFRIAQEALRNGIVHGDARRLGVSLVRSDDSIELSVADDGRGFDLAAVHRDGTGLGLVSIEERAHVLGGSVEMDTRPECGARIRVRIPVSGTARAQKENVQVHLRVLPSPHLSTSAEPL